MKLLPPALTLAITLEPESAVPLYQQLYNVLRDSILNGRLEKGTRLPSTRILADELSISRNTVTNAFDQLLAEGYLESYVGDGTYVTHSLPDDTLQPRQIDTQPTNHATTNRRISRRGQLLLDNPVIGAYKYQRELRTFRAGLPSVEQFPFEVWARLESKYWRVPSRDVLGYGDAAGYPPLRKAIAHYLNTARAVHCTPDQVIVVTGSQQGLDLAGRVLIDPGDPVWIEDPGYRGARGALLGAGATLIPVPIDSEGLAIEAGLKRESKARMVYVSPSHQHPLGITMSLRRRLSLLEWASANDAWILEDDYDSEYRYNSRPIASLQGLDKENRVIYIGTFSKVLFPALRIGYLVVPPDLVDAFLSTRAILDRHSPTLEQAVLAEFITEGHFARHIRRTRLLYAERQAALIKAAKVHLDGLLTINPADSGMHLIGWLPDNREDREVAKKALEAGVEVMPLSNYTIEPSSLSPFDCKGVVMGYASFNEQEIWQGTYLLGKALREK